MLDYLSEREEAQNQELMEDVACVALNLLPPHYVRHSIDLAMHINDEEREKMVIQVQQAVIKAAELVKSNAARRPAKFPKLKLN